MIEIPYYDADGEQLDPIEVDPALFGGLVRWRLLKEAVLMHEANRRQGNHSSKTRAEVATTNTKPWRQKGTGRARAGTAGSPIWKGGGVAHGPRPRHHGWNMPRKKRRQALDSALLGKMRDGEVKCIAALEFEEPRTKQAVSVLDALGIEGKVLVGLGQHDETTYKSFRNIPKVRVIEVRNLSPHSVVDGGTLLLTRAALDALLSSRSGNQEGE